MSLSEKYIQLEARLHELRTHLLPEQFSEIGIYTSQQLDMFKGYRLLVHAEFESYLEDISKETIFASIRKWKANKLPSITIVSFLAAYHSSWSVSDELHNEEIIKLAKGRTHPKESIQDTLTIASKQFNTKLSSNNGIKADNFKTLIFPTGIDIDELDPALLTELDNFGVARGDIAHNSSKKVTTEINPQDELSKVTFLLSCIKTLDEKLNALVQ